MTSINKVLLIGRLGKDPEFSTTKGGKSVTNFSIATSEVWINKTTGKKEENTDWHNIRVLGKRADLCRDYLNKGSRVYIEGRLITDSWEDHETGKKNYFTYILVNQVRFLDSKKDENQSQRF